MENINSNILILLHGLGDTSQNFLEFGLKLQLPQTRLKSLQGNFEIPLFDGRAWWNSFDCNGNMLPRQNCRDGLKVLTDCLRIVLTEYPPERVFLLGFGQGSEIIDLYLKENNLAIGGAISIAGTELSHGNTPTLNMKVMPRNRNETLDLMEFFSKRLWLRNLELEKLADRVVEIEKLDSDST